MKCSQKKCEQTATWSYVWPGDPDRKYACDECVIKAQRIAQAMGVYLGDARRIEDER